MSRLLVVSNRAPVEIERGPDGVRMTRTVGGLAGALDDALRVQGGTWIAWIGPHGAEELTSGETGLAYPIRAVRLKDREVNDYYAGFANQVLWPLCHTFPSRVHVQPRYWTAYRQANERFASAVQGVVAPGDLVWVHDYHLCLVPRLLRTGGVPARIGVFWHIPFPPPSVFGILRWRQDLLAGLLGADLIGFQTDNDASNFLASVRHYMDVPVIDNPPRVVLPGREVSVVALPIGVDYASFHGQAADPAVRTAAAQLRTTLGADGGVLVLSEFAGAAHELREAVIVNPYDPESIRRALEIALAMSADERRRRMRALARRVAARDLGWWTHAFLDRLAATAGPAVT